MGGAILSGAAVSENQLINFIWPYFYCIPTAKQAVSTANCDQKDSLYHK